MLLLMMMLLLLLKSWWFDFVLLLFTILTMACIRFVYCILFQCMFFHVFDTAEVIYYTIINMQISSSKFIPNNIIYFLSCKVYTVFFEILSILIFLS